MVIRSSVALVLLSLAVTLGGCALGGQHTVPAEMQSAAIMRELSGTGAGKIQHIVFIVQENRSFDDLFQGYPGADTVKYGKNSSNQKVALQPVTLATKYEIDHSATAMFTACDGLGRLPGTKCRMNGFDKEYAYGGPPYNPQYAYVPHTDSKPYFDMAHEWVLADKTFASQLDESFVAHQYIIAAQAASAVNLPYSLWGCPGGYSDKVSTITQSRDPRGPTEVACFDYQTLGDELDAAKLTWKFYTSKYNSPSSGQGAYYSSYQAVKHIYKGPDWKKDVITPQKRFLQDVPAGKLANFTWITPICVNSDHVNCGGGHGPSWVTSLVNVVGKSKFWKTTAIFVIWDDWGGLYDHVPPPFKDYDGLGFRVPLLIISPYAKADYVSHVQYETASVLRFAEDLFGLDRLAAADKRAASPAGDCFDFSRKPRRFVPIQAPLDRNFFLSQQNNGQVPDYE
jgi:phospholipase C